ncbi:MAG: alpha-mannosidase, partial [Firmicutes bacterium]|nr:alpha-mannosidase [Bacillota bacterium]
MPDESNRALQALQLRILELRAWRNRTVAPLPPGSFQAQDMQKPAPFKPGDPWPSRVFPVHITFSPVVPDAWRGNPVRLYLDVEGEALLRVNGQPKGGLLGPMPDGQGGSFPYQREYELTPAAQGGETIRIDVDAVPRGRFGVPVREPHFRQGYLLVPDPQVRSLYEDLLAVWDVAQNLDPAAAQGEREFLVDLLQQVVARVRLPDSRTGNYLAALGRDPAASAPLLTVWDEWDLSAQGEPAALGELHRRSLEEAAALLQAGLAELRQRFGLHAAGGSLALAGHAHIDLAWLWPLAETRRKAIRTFSSVLTLMERYPDFVFSQSAAQLYAFVEADDPQLFRRIQARVAEGRWEPIGGTWVEMDCNLASGESLVRQFLYGQRYFQRAFGRKSQVLWLPDTFGFTGALPQIAHQAGIRYFFTTKLYWNDRDLFPYDLYWWEGIDGTRLLAHLFRNENQGYNGNIQAFDLLNTWKNFRGKARHPESLFSFGWGDGGGGPSEEMLERYQRLKDFPGLPQSRMSTAEAFFERVDTKRPLPVWVGEQYLEFHRGTYTTQGRIKWLNRHCEQRLYEAEALAALAARLGAQAYPREALAQAWQTLLRNQFHDILP